MVSRILIENNRNEGVWPLGHYPGVIDVSGDHRGLCGIGRLCVELARRGCQVRCGIPYGKWALS